MADIISLGDHRSAQELASSYQAWQSGVLPRRLMADELELAGFSVAKIDVYLFGLETGLLERLLEGGASLDEWTSLKADHR